MPSRQRAFVGHRDVEAAAFSSGMTSLRERSTNRDLRLASGGSTVCTECCEVTGHDNDRICRSPKPEVR